MSLDASVAQIVMRARQIERAVHDPGPWSVTVGGRLGEHHLPLRKVVGEDHVTFYGLVPLWEEQVASSTGFILAELRCGDDLVALRPLEPINDYAEIAWQFLVINPEQVAA